MILEKLWLLSRNSGANVRVRVVAGNRPIAQGGLRVCADSLELCKLIEPGLEAIELRRGLVAGLQG